VFGCLVCQRNEAQTIKKAGLLQPLSIPSFKWESVSMDFFTQLPVTKSGYDAIAVFVDKLTKMVHFAPTFTDCSARDVARLFNDTVFKHPRLPSEVIWIEIPGSHLRSGPGLLVCWAQSSKCQSPSILRQMVRRRGITAFLKIISGTTSVPLKMTGMSGCLRQSSR
jgi:hypothetical protein